MYLFSLLDHIYNLSCSSDELTLTALDASSLPPHPTASASSLTATISIRLNSIVYILIKDNSYVITSFVSETLDTVDKDEGAIPRIEKLCLTPTTVTNSSPEDTTTKSKLPSELHKFILDPRSAQLETVHVVINNSAGSRNARHLWNVLLSPLVEEAKPRSHISVSETQAENDGVRVGHEIADTDAERNDGDDPITLIVLGGDGTLGEVLNGYLFDRDGRLRRLRCETRIVIIPTGTANALYHHHFPPTINTDSSRPSSSYLQNYHSFLSYLYTSESQLKPLPLALNHLHRTNERTLTTVVTSTALHANILYDAEKLRAQIEGLKRFKIAAGMNANQWSQAHVNLFPSNEKGAVEIYDPKIKAFRAFGDRDERNDREGTRVEKNEDQSVRIEGPFCYFVSSLSSRFEENFIVAPLRSSNDPAQESTIDVVIIRPLRNSIIREQFERDPTSAKGHFVEKVWNVVGGMYRGGEHIDLVWSEEEGGEVVVEYYRCKAIEWRIVSFFRQSTGFRGQTRSSRADPKSSKQKDSEDIKDRLVCLDGAIQDLGQPRDGGGSVKTEALGYQETGISIWA